MPETYQETDTIASRFKSYIADVTDHQDSILPLIDGAALPAAREELEALCGTANRTLRKLGYIGSDAIIHTDAITYLPVGRAHVERKSAAPARGRYEGLAVLERGTIAHKIADNIVDPRYSQTELSRYAFTELESDAIEIIKAPPESIPEELKPHLNELITDIEQSSLQEYDDIWQKIRQIYDGQPSDKAISWFFDKLEKQTNLQNMAVVGECDQAYICPGDGSMSFMGGIAAEIQSTGEFLGFTTTPDREIVKENGEEVRKVNDYSYAASLAIAINDGKHIVKIPVRACKDLTCVEDVAERARE
jgi:hypothetical protein